MSTLLAATILLGFQKPKTVRVPVYNYDTQTKYTDSYFLVTVPAGFTEVGVGKGEFSSKAGKLMFTVAKSKGPMPAAQRNPNAKKDEEWSTIRLIKWIGYRNLFGKNEVYVLNWTNYRLNVTLTFANKKDLPVLRKGLNHLVDTLTMN
jgi:hypothetical protein